MADEDFGERTKEPLAIQLARGSLVAPLATVMYSGCVTRSLTPRDQFESTRAKVQGYGILGMAIVGLVLFVAAVLEVRRRPVAGFWKYAASGGILSCLILVSWVLAVARADVARAPSDPLADRVGSLMQQGDFAQAEVAARELVERNPREGSALALLGVTQLRQDRALEARTSFASAVTLLAAEPGKALELGIAQDALAVAMMQLEDYEAADKQFEAALKTMAAAVGTSSGHYADSLRNRGLLRTYEGDYARGLPEVRRAIEIYERLPAAVPRGAQLQIFRQDYIDLLHEAGQVEEALRLGKLWNMATPDSEQAAP